MIVIDDVVPNSYAASLPDQLDAIRVKDYLKSDDDSWMGDTFKLVFFIETFFPSFQLRTIADNHGQAVVWRSPTIRATFQEATVKQIAETSFLDVITEGRQFHVAAFAEILDEFSRCRHGSIAGAA